MKVLRTGSRTFLPGNSVLDCTLSATDSYFRTIGWMKRERKREKEGGRKNEERGGRERGKEKERERREAERE